MVSVSVLLLNFQSVSIVNCEEVIIQNYFHTGGITNTGVNFIAALWFDSKVLSP
jgi:hypothetical protein